MKPIQFVTLCLALSVIINSCVSNVLDPPEQSTGCATIDATYNGAIKSIIDASCAYSGCHDGSGGIGPGDFTSYDRMSTRFDQFRARIVDFANDPSLGMPPNGSVYPVSKKDDLTPEEFDAMVCWMDAGFPE